MILTFILGSLAVSTLGSPALASPGVRPDVGHPRIVGGQEDRIVGHPRIVGGQEATPNQFPWQISLQFHIFAIGLYQHRCGATIVDDTHIVCAAHCIDGQTERHFRVVAGAHSLHPLLPESSKQIRKVSRMWQHADFDKFNFTNDVSVLEFNEFVKPLLLAEQGQAPEGGVECINSGWGVTDDGRTADKLQYVSLPVVDHGDCIEDYGEVNGVEDGMVCAGGDAGPCQGDSGGPLVCPGGASGDDYLAGIVSWGVVPCGQPQYPGVFTNVGYYRDWIDMHVNM